MQTLLKKNLLKTITGDNLRYRCVILSINLVLTNPQSAAGEAALQRPHRPDGASRLRWLPRSGLQHDPDL